MNSWIEKIEKYFDDIPLAQQPEVRDFLEEYYEKKDTHSATSLEGLSDDELGELLYLDTKIRFNDDLIEKLHKCKKLKILSSDDRLACKHIVQFTNLRILDLYSAIQVSKRLFLLKKLLVLDLGVWQVKRFLEERFLPTNLLFCKIRRTNDENGYDILQFPSNFSNLISLDFSYSKINTILSLSLLKNLVELNLDGNPISIIPSSISHLNKLRQFYLVDCKIKELPKEVFQLANLEVLDVSGNKISILSEEISDLTNLEILDIAYNKLLNLPNTILELQNLKDLRVFKNPFETPQILKSLNLIIEETSYENEIFVLDILKNQKPVAQDYNYFTLKVPKILQTAMLQYIEFFKDYVEATKGKDIIFDVKRDNEGLVLVTNGNIGVTLLELGSYFQEYVALVGQNSEDWILNFEVPRNVMQADILRLKLDRQITSLESDLNIARLESKFLETQLSDAQAQISFLKDLSNSLSKKIDILINGQSTINEPNTDQLLLDIIDQGVKMLERKYTHSLENLHNDVLTDFLREKWYYVTDQTRSGRAKLDAGEIDIMIRKQNGTPYSIIEAFRLASCGEKNKTVAQHLDKLIHDYDTAGHARNFVVVYAEAKDFERLWINYTNYVNQLNGKIDFRVKYPLISFIENTDSSKKTSIKIGVAKHRREGEFVEVYHVFINMFGGLQ
ncbi:MAG: leucine-rich repeat domain-containing protein [Saprospiraceae bacterium]